MNDADEALAKSTFAKLNNRPYNTMHAKVKLQTNPEAMEVGKSYIICWDDWGSPRAAEAASSSPRNLGCTGSCPCPADTRCALQIQVCSQRKSCWPVATSLQAVEEAPLGGSIEQK